VNHGENWECRARSPYLLCSVVGRCFLSGALRKRSRTGGRAERGRGRADRVRQWGSIGRRADGANVCGTTAGPRRHRRMDSERQARSRRRIGRIRRVGGLPALGRIPGADTRGISGATCLSSGRENLASRVFLNARVRGSSWMRRYFGVTIIVGRQRVNLFLHLTAPLARGYRERFCFGVTV
jgi:hypothetical protein